MSKTLIIAIVLSIAVIAIVLADTMPSLMVHQTNTVPPKFKFSAFQADGVTPVNAGDDMGSLWNWTGSQFTLTLNIANTGNTAITPQFVPSQGNFTGWTFQVSGNNTLPIGQNENCALTLIPPGGINAPSGTSTGDWDLTITCS
jgi:hypothetical protein